MHAGALPARRLPRDTRSLAAIRLLLERGADKTAHANERSLMMHLVGTAQLLRAWNAPVDTVRAGLCHSIYGTNAFRKASMAREERALLQRAIGRRAEDLVWSFSKLRRPATLLRALKGRHSLVRERSGRTRHIAQATLEQLFVLECANLLDQGVSMQRARELSRQAARLPCVPSAMTHDIRIQLRMSLLARSAAACIRHSG